MPFLLEVAPVRRYSTHDGQDIFTDTAVSRTVNQNVVVVSPLSWTDGARAHAKKWSNVPQENNVGIDPDSAIFAKKQNTEDVAKRLYTDQALILGINPLSPVIETGPRALRGGINSPEFDLLGIGLKISACRIRRSVLLVPENQTVPSSRRCVARNDSIMKLKASRQGPRQ